MEGASGIALITTGRAGENNIVVVPGANGHLTPKQLEKAATILEYAGFLLAQLEIPLETVEYLAQFAERHNIPLMLDPAPARELPGSLLRKVSWITPNETETEELLKTKLENNDTELLRGSGEPSGPRCQECLIEVGIARLPHRPRKSSQRAHPRLLRECCGYDWRRGRIQRGICSGIDARLHGRAERCFCLCCCSDFGNPSWSAALDADLGRGEGLCKRTLGTASILSCSRIERLGASLEFAILENVFTKAADWGACIVRSQLRRIASLTD